MSKFPCKICGLTTIEDVDSCARAGAAYIGLNFFPKSPRYVDIAKAHALAMATPVGLARVALTVNADNDLLDAITGGVPVDILQLHGSETPERIAEVRARYGLPVMKAVGVADADDLPALEIFGKAADLLLVDAKKPKHSELPGGNGLAFDWTLIAKRRWPVPWLLAGGLTPEIVAEAIAMTGAKQVDVSSGVESAPGVKDATMIADFVAAASKPKQAPPILS